MASFALARTVRTKRNEVKERFGIRLIPKGRIRRRLGCVGAGGGVWRSPGNRTRLELTPEPPPELDRARSHREHLALAIVEEMSKRVGDNRKCKLLPGNLIFTEQFDRKRLFACLENRLGQSREKEHVDLRDMLSLIHI